MPVRSNDRAAAGKAAVFSEMELSRATRTALAAMEISEPTPIQQETIPLLLAGRDVIGQARTGSGKTLAFATPMVERCDPRVHEVQALVLTPTRELAIQVGQVTDAVAKSQGLHTTLLYGGRSARPEQSALRRGAQIVIGTPGRTLDHLRQGTLDLRSVRFLVLDEADEMLDRGFARDVEGILGYTPSERQTAMFSATLPDWVATTAAKHLRQPATVEVDADLQTLPSVTHLVYSIRRDHKIGALRSLLDERNGEAVIVFGKTKHGVKKLARQLDELGYPVGALQGNLRQNARERVMREFRSGGTPILVATNVAARGLDIDGVGQVINYDLPDSPQLFTHRVGRTGRMGREGEAITFVTPEEESKWREIDRSLGVRFVRRPWNDDPELQQPVRRRSRVRRVR
ncbi:MAG: DEAD/DEAH box helicase [Chloroflexota bacterium]|nr:DEAD/DEAH box helicase [Chloroflexota bacterium]